MLFVMVWSALFCFSASASSLGVRHTPSWCPKPFTLPVCRSCGSPSLLGVLSSLPFHDQTGVRPGWQLWLLGDGRGASRKIFALWYCLKTELFMVFVVLVAMQIQIKRVLFFWMLLIHAFFSPLFPLPKLDRVFLWALPVLAVGLKLPCQLAVMLLVWFVSLPSADSLNQVHEELPGAHSNP